MKINKLKINAYGKLKDKEIDFSDHINIIYGKNEKGKSTLLTFIENCFYGISKNKRGKEISDFEKYTPWIGEDFSGKIEYQLDTKEKFEVFRDFRKKNPQIFNEQMEDISKQFNIDKNKGNEFFYEQTKVDEALFLSTVLVNQQEVKLEQQERNVFIQKIANLVGTGEDNVSFKRAIDRIDRRKLDEIGTERSRERPINRISKKILEGEEQKLALEKYKEIKYEIEENRNNLKQEIEALEKENQFLQEIKWMNEKEKIEKEKINLKVNLKKENDEKIKLVKNQIKEKNEINASIFEENKKINAKKNNINIILIILFLAIFCMEIVSFIFWKETNIKYLFLLAIPVFFVGAYLLKINIKRKELKIKNRIEKINSEMMSLDKEKDLLETNNQELEREIKQTERDFKSKIELEKEKIENNYLDYIEQSKMKKWSHLEDINGEIQNLENKLSQKKIEWHTLDLEDKNIEPKLEDLSTIEENLVNDKEKMKHLKDLESSMNLAKEVLNHSYEKMKSTVTPKFTEKLSQTIAEITNQKYNNVKLSEDNGLVVELENGNYVSVSRLSIGTIDQLYLSLRLAMVENLSEEKMPIILDEAFAYYDTERLSNILQYIAHRFKEHQVILLTCTNREQEILEKLRVTYNWIQM